MYSGGVTTALRPRPNAARRIGAERAVELFHALSDPTRLAIIEMLKSGERCVCELQDELDAAQSRLSFHLKVLRGAGLLADRREGRWSYYRIVPEGLAEGHDATVSLKPPRTSLPVRQSACCT